MTVARTGPVVGFDLDMTLVDSAAGITATAQAALAEVGLGVTREQMWPYVGIPLQHALARIVPQVDAEAITIRYRQLYAEYGIPSITALPGAAEAFEAVHRAGGRVLVVSAKAEAAVHRVLAHVGLDEPPDAPDLVVGGRFAAAKGAVLRREGAHVYVGDHPGDIEAARVGGAVAVGVATGSTPPEQLTAAGADVVLADLRGFPAWLAEHSRFLSDPPPTPGHDHSTGPRLSGPCAPVGITLNAGSRGSR